MLVSSKMNQVPIWLLFISFFLLLHTTKSDEEVEHSLISSLEKLSNNNSPPDLTWGWNLTSDPCKDHWKGIICDKQNVTVKKIFLNGLSFSGSFDASALCNVKSLAVSLTAISLNDNNISGENLDQIGNCRQLTRLHISGNRSMSQFNNFSGPIPKEAYRFTVSSFIGSPELCGGPLPNGCPSLPSESLASAPQTEISETDKSKGISKEKIVMFSVYFLLALVLFFLVILRLCKKDKKKEEKIDADNKVAAVDDSVNRPSAPSNEYKIDVSKSENSVASAETESAMISSSSLVVLTSPVVNGLRFEALLKAPAELLGRGKHGTVYKVICEEGMTLAIKRIKDWAISSNDFRQRMQRLDQVKHPNVLPTIAFYCSMQEKLLVYEYQQNGSLRKLLLGTQIGEAFDWSSRLGIAATIIEALAFMHQELHDDGIAHGNLKSSNILLNNNMDPCISEYGLMAVDNLDQPSLVNVNSQKMTGQSENSFKSDIYGFGVILLELLTGKVVQNNTLDLARWVLSVVREEWTVEVFDKMLIREGASEERMVSLLQVAIKCVNHSPEARPSINQVALMINTVREEEERSIVSEA
ncbi:hypothetical protein F0562_004667 [Nyssa sinensis]|uniref:Protein kinase domain-containing protein n=1 Tax=Nyssa sinensis TaxID=561372 RepID=A0A5J5C298_9ASTE|nr:hypothetical protein F0562_004667 [Nyssa sinensis]